MSEFSERVYTIVSGIPAGKTMTYKEVAAKAENPKAARAVGNILNKNPDLTKIPCHRVIRSDGDLGGYVFGRAKKRELLKREGVV